MAPPCIYDLLPWDVIPEVLSFLPVASLLRFRSVSKQWCALIYSPNFISKHLLNSNTDPKLITPGNNQVLYADLNRVDEESIADFIPLEYHPSDTCNGLLLGCCNGLICVRTSDPAAIILWNPSTRRYQTIPRFCDLRPGYFPLPFFGLGYDAVNHDYKLVMFMQFDSSDGSSCHLAVYIYTLNSDCWRRVERVIPYRILHGITAGIFVGGALHWTVASPSDNNAVKIIAFDVGTEEYREFPIPEYQSHPDNMYLVHVLGGSLSFVYSCPDYMDVWVMEEYGVGISWKKLVSSVSNSRFSLFILNHLGPLAYSKCCKKVLLQVGPEEFIWYHLQNNVKSNVKTHFHRPITKSFICLGSLVPLKHSIDTSTTTGKRKREVQI